MKLQRAWIFMFVLVFISQTATPQNIDWSPENRISFRTRLFENETYLQPIEKDIDNSVGIRLSTNSPEDFRKSLLDVLESKGTQPLKNSKIYILGVEMNQEKAVREKFSAVIKDMNLADLNIQIIVLSVPPAVLKQMSIQGAQSVFQNIKYFFPNLAKDYQTPTWGELSSGFNANLLIEVPTIAFLFQQLPGLDASLAATTHAAIIGSYIVFQKTIGNWINRPGTSNKAMFLKQAILSFPFVLNFNIFGNFSNILNFVNQNGYDAALAQIPNQISNFTSTQSFTLFLQTLFYFSFMSKGIRNWVNNQKGSENVRIARTVSNYNAVPFLVLDAIFLPLASTPQQSLMSLGYFDVNLGHLLLASLATVGSIFWFKPDLFDPTIRWYSNYEKWKQKHFSNWLKTTSQNFTSTCQSYF